MAKCTTCGSDIVFVRMESGGKMPLDAHPLVGGSILIREDGIGVVVPPDARAGRVLYVSHFITCPQAAAHRRRGAR
jgi:hypothetical protein